ncbi:PapD-like protein [Suillus clintonianus]|uniref:PapD-like protein n=1 Tax=Suillus clintonianus TaxID=1904413 RepID=UPI001B862405|nr:PapD-like protein [Suillus clintonianus]KAG2129486.1 PapD-like protein [Suillus clintonianus]
MSVHLIPNNALGFNRPFSQLVKQVLTITNKNAQPVAFKVKTTAPKLYCVRPNSGRVEPGESVDVSVMLQPMKDEPPLSSKCKDKFLIQSTLITPEKETRDLQEFWKVYQQKLRVVYLPPEGQIPEEEDEGHVEPPMPPVLHSEHVGGPSNYATLKNPESRPPPAMPEFSFDDAVQAAPLVQPQRSATPPAPEREVNSSQEYREELEFQRSTSGGVGVVNVNVHSPSPPASPPVARAASINQELEAKFIAAQDEIQRLRDLLAAVPDPSSLAPESIAPTSIAPSDFRRRHTSALSDDGETYAGSDVGTMVEHDSVIHQEGVPLQVVVIIALGVFITTYLFF